MKTYTATQTQKIDGYAVVAGDVIGHGSGGDWKPSAKTPRITWGHVAARLYSGMIEQTENDSTAKRGRTKKKTSGK